MRIQTYRDESRSRHSDLIYGGASKVYRPRLCNNCKHVAGEFACALVIPFAPAVAHLSQWVR